MDNGKISKHIKKHKLLNKMLVAGNATQSLRYLFRIANPDDPFDIWHSLKPYEFETVNEIKQRIFEISYNPNNELVRWYSLLVNMEVYKEVFLSAQIEYVNSFLASTTQPGSFESDISKVDSVKLALLDSVKLALLDPVKLAPLDSVKLALLEPVKLASLDTVNCTPNDFNSPNEFNSPSDHRSANILGGVISKEVITLKGYESMIQPIRRMIAEYRNFITWTDLSFEEKFELMNNIICKSANRIDGKLNVVIWKEYSKKSPIRVTANLNNSPIISRWLVACCARFIGLQVTDGLKDIIEEEAFEIITSTNKTDNNRSIKIRTKLMKFISKKITYLSNSDEFSNTIQLEFVYRKKFKSDVAFINGVNIVMPFKMANEYGVCICGLNEKNHLIGSYIVRIIF